MTANDEYPIGSVRTTFRIVDALDEAEEAGVTDIAKVTGVSKGSVHKHLATLRSLGYVVKDGTDYRLSIRFLAIGNRRREQNTPFHAAKPTVDNLADTTGGAVNLTVPEQGYGVYAYRAGGASGVSGYLPAVGERVYLHATAGGKAILSQLDRDDVAEIVADHGLPKLTEKTIDTERELRRELRSIRDRGLAFERGEHLPSVQCVAAPITTDEGPVGAISVSGSIDQMSGKKLEEDLAGLVVSAANEIELDIFNY